MSTLETIDREITEIFKDVTRGMWQILSPILGPTMTQYLFGVAVSDNSGEFPWLRVVQFTEEGPTLEELDGTPGPDDQIEMRRGLAAVVSTVLETLTVLTGDILTSDMPPSVTEFVKSGATKPAMHGDTSQRTRAKVNKEIELR